MELDKLTEWLWCLRSEHVQAYAVVGADGVYLVDTSTGDQQEPMLRLLAQELGVQVRDVPLREIVLTHGHPDHTGSAAALARATRAQVLGPAAEESIIAGEQPQGKPDLLDWERPLYKQSMAALSPAEPLRLDVGLRPGDPLAWPKAAELVAAPGHTSGQLVVWFPEDRVLLAADAMASHEGRPMLGVFNVDRAQAIDSFERLCELPAEIACFGHGDPVMESAQTRLREVAAALQPG